MKQRPRPDWQYDTDEAEPVQALSPRKRPGRTKDAFASNAASGATRKPGRRLPPQDPDELPSDPQRALHTATVEALRSLYATMHNETASPETRQRAAADLLSYSARYCARCAQEVSL